VVTCYNYRQYVREAVDSALAQRLKPLEVIVVDDGSTDGSREQLAESYGESAGVKLLFKNNGGQLSAFIAGVAECKGDIICFLDADDVWELDYLERLSATYREHPETDFVFSNLRFFGKHEGLWHSETQDRDYGLTALVALFRQYWIGSPTSALTMRREVATCVLDLPVAFYADWRVRADDCLVYGASVLGARKRYMATIAGRYRSHASNAWFSRRDAHDRVVKLRHLYRVQRLLAYYRNAWGFDCNSLRYAKLEFQTRTLPTREEVRLYLDLIGRSPLSSIKKLEHSFSVIRHYWRQRHSGTAPSPEQLTKVSASQRGSPVS
jgi:glycosyltransferase involved in cell wall biosynthesis